MSTPTAPKPVPMPPSGGRRAFLRLAASGALVMSAPALFGGGVAWGAAAHLRDPERACPEGDPGSYTAATPGRAGTFLLFSDVHFDPFADPGIVKALAAAPAGEWHGILTGNRAGIGAGAAFSPYGQDANNALFQSFLDDMARRVPRPDFLLYPGDLLCHRFWTTYPQLTGDSSSEGLLSFIAKTAEYFLAEVTRRFPDAPLFLALGNNDSFEGDFRIAPRSPYLSATAPLIARLALKQDAARAGFLQTYPQLGCYTAPLPVPGCTLIVFNNIFWAKHSPHQDAGTPVLEFLGRELAAAARRGEKVWLMAHVPPGDNSKASAARFLKKGMDAYAPLLLDPWNGALANLLVEHAATIRAAFAGHVHRDEFRLVYPAGGGLPAVSMRLGPSVSPVTGNNPGYQAVSYDRESLELLDMTTHYLDIGADTAAWEEEYRYSRTYGMGLRAPRDWEAMYQSLLTCPDRAKAFGQAFDLRSAHINEVNKRTFPIFWKALGLSAGA